MHRIKKVSADILQEKLEDTAVTPDDTSTKRDIMSLLVRARVADKSGGYHMSDATIMDQVVCRSADCFSRIYSITCIADFPGSWARNSCFWIILGTYGIFWLLPLNLIVRRPFGCLQRTPKLKPSFEKK